jgi:polygalacturonase
MVKIRIGQNAVSTLLALQLEKNEVLSNLINIVITIALLATICTNEAIAREAIDPSTTNVSCLDVANFGAVGDGVKMNTTPIQLAVNACPAGGMVWLHNGTFLSGTIILHSDMTFYIDTNATLLGGGSTSDYPVLTPAANDTQQSTRVLVSAQSCINVTIAGGGIINGNGGYANYPTNFTGIRPSPICTELCSNVTIQNLTITNSPGWNVVNIESDYLTINNVNINDAGLCPYRDGFDICDCWHVIIENCTNISAGDDGIVLKSGCSRGVNDFVATNCTVTRSAANGLKLGTTSMGPITNILFQNCTVMNTKKAAMAVESVDGSDITDVTFSNINFSGCQNAIFIILGSRDAGVRPGGIDGISYRNITGSSLTESYGCPISGTLMTNGMTYSLKNILFDNVNINFAGSKSATNSNPPEYAGQYPENTMWNVSMPGYGYYIRHATNVCFTNSFTSAASADARPWIFTEDVSDLHIPLPQLTIMKHVGPMVLHWGNGSSLQFATNLSGTFHDVFRAPSPYTNTLPNARVFFRVCP